MTFQEIIASQSFTELETIILNACDSKLKMFYGEYFSDLEVKDLAEYTNLGINVVKGVVGSLKKKGILDTEPIRCGDGITREFVYFTEQENM